MRTFDKNYKVCYIVCNQSCYLRFLVNSMHKTYNNGKNTRFYQKIKQNHRLF